MIHSPASVDDVGVLRHILLGASTILLDFDGPICSVFAGLPARVVADQLRLILAEGGHYKIPSAVQKTDDPFDVLAFAALLGGEEARYTEAALRAHEVEAVGSAEPTSGAHDLIRTLHATGRKLAVVSNNSTTAVKAYLDLHEITPFVHYISARINPNPTLLKPDPFLIHQAHAKLGVLSSSCVLIGDSTTDIQAARAAQTPSIGYANKPGKVDLLKGEAPQAIVTSIDSLRSALPA